MQARGFFTLITLTALVIAAAVALTVFKAPPKPDTSAGSPALPQVSQRAADIGSIIVQRDKGTVTLTRGPSGWSVAERNNYPADPAKADVADQEHQDGCATHQHRGWLGIAGDKEDHHGRHRERDPDVGNLRQARATGHGGRALLQPLSAGVPPSPLSRAFQIELTDFILKG